MAKEGSFTAELKQLDFDSMLGAPMIAVMKALVHCGEQTVEFIREYVLEESSGSAGGTLAMMTFEYKRPAPKGGYNLVSMAIPLFTLIAIPNLRLDSLAIEFNTTLTHQQKTEASFGVSVTAEADIEFEVKETVKVTASASFSAQVSMESSSESTKSYNMTVRMEVEEHDAPGWAAMTELLTSIVDEQSKIPGLES
mmetsp:Transcript_36086/g.90561  ORF Transcript_36086/g.90561 Transcript_36086/m.90561 type:complete len:196 (-) Transcript_36086:23-610(-)